MNGCSIDAAYPINGQDKKTVCIGGSNAPFGKEAIGKDPLGGDLSEQTGLPPYFNVIKDLVMQPYFAQLQVSFYSNDVDLWWEILSFGPSLPIATDLRADITQ